MKKRRNIFWHVVCAPFMIWISVVPLVGLTTASLLIDNYIPLRFALCIFVLVIVALSEFFGVAPAFVTRSEVAYQRKFAEYIYPGITVEFAERELLPNVIHRVVRSFGTNEEHRL
jgi:hypothetical protein